MSGTTRACRGATFARTSDTIEFAFPFSTTKETKRERETCASYGASSYALTFLVSDFASPPGKSFSPIEIRKHAKERKKERTNDTRYIIVLTNDVHISVVSASVSSLGQFYRYLVRLHHGTDASTQRTTSFKFHLNDDEEEEGKEKRERSKTRSASLNNALDINVPSVLSAARILTNASLVFEGEKGSAFMVRRWFKTFVRFEKNVFFSSQT